MAAMKPSNAADTGVDNPKFKGKTTCTVGLKSPNGLILRLFKKTAQMENTPSGPREIEKFEVNLDHEPVTLRGYKGAAFGQVQPFRISGQYAMTENVDLEFMKEWMRQNKELDLVKNGLIFIAPDDNYAVSQGNDQRGNWDGLHPLRMTSADPSKKDPRVPRKVRTLSKQDDDGGETLSAPSRPMPSEMTAAPTE